jgi:hypothetical protein
VPVWHEFTKKWRESGELAVIGITQEQHPDRCRLFAQWHGIDWPILWDPFNLSGSRGVPNFTAIDERGVVRMERARRDRFEAEFLSKRFHAMGMPERITQPAVREELSREDPSCADEAISVLLWRGVDCEHGEAALEVLAVEAEGSERGTAFFRYGVAACLRHDSSSSGPGDFAAAVSAWGSALAADPNQYIWRRRLQQYGPRLDKPYPFYTWIDEARAAIRERGEEPVSIAARLTGAEVMTPAASGEKRGDERSPDPDGAITRDSDGLLEIDGTVVSHTDNLDGREKKVKSARLHLFFRPDRKRDVHWSNDAGETVVWIEPPSGWTAPQRLFHLAGPTVELSDEVRTLDLELLPGPDAEAIGEVRGYSLSYLCEGKDGRCLYLRRDFAVAIE